MRGIFTDGLNSVWHFAFGFLAVDQPIIFVTFAAYQLFTLDDNTIVDLSEFALGIGANKLINK